MEAALRVTAKLPQHHSALYHGIPVVIEWPKGSVREGKGPDGKPWRRTMNADYGFIDDTEAKGDEEPLDIYIASGDWAEGADPSNPKVYIIEQLDGKGDFDEYKLVAGVPDLETAQELYLSHYPKEWGQDRLGDCYEAALDSLRGKVEEHQGETKQAGERHGGPVPTREEAEKVRRFLQERIGPSAKVMVVGSTAGGTQGPGSDIDILLMPPEGVNVNDWWIEEPLNIERAMTEMGYRFDHSPMTAEVQCEVYQHKATGIEVDLFYGEPWKGASIWKQGEENMDRKTAGEEARLLESIRGTDKDMAGSKLSGFWHDGPATCMDCVHRTPHSQRKDGTQADSCKHPVVMADPEVQDKKLPDGTIEVDADDWCRFARKPQKGGGDEEKASGQPEKPPRKASIGSIYMKVLGSMD